MASRAQGGSPKRSPKHPGTPARPNRSSKHPGSPARPKRKHAPHPKSRTGGPGASGGLTGLGGLNSLIAAVAGSAAAKSIAGIGQDNDVSSHGSPGGFNMYLMAQSWAPTFCCTNGKKCKAEHMADLTDVSPHGLWPAFQEADTKTGRTYPAFCTSKKSGEQGRRKQHEYEKHGTCTRLTEQQYFSEESRLTASESLAESRELLERSAGGSVDRGELLAAYGGSDMAALMTTKKCKLAEVTTCWAKNADDTVGEQIPCPDHILGSSRNSAALGHCARVFIDRARSCTKITDDMLKVFKEAQFRK